MRFSVLIPVYNVQDYLKECLDSIYKQSYKDFEVIIIDDGSTDKSAIICDKYKYKYFNKTKLLHKKNEGLLKARRDALSVAEGEYIIFCDSDDLLEYDSLKVLDQKIKQFNPDIIQYDLYTFTDKNQFYNINSGKTYFKANVLYDDISILQKLLLNREYNIWSMAGKCVRKSLYNLHENYNDYKHISFGEDSLQSLEIYSSAKNFIYISDRLYCYRSFSGMTKKLPYKYLNDFYDISNFYENHKNQFKFDGFDTYISIFNMNVIYEYFLNFSNNKYSYKDLKEAINYINDYTKFREKYKKYLSVKQINWKMNILTSLVYKKRYTILYFLLIIRNKVKN